MNDKMKYTKENCAGAASVLCLCKASCIEVSNRAVDSWFVGIMCVLGLYKLGWQYITMIKTVTTG